MACHSQVRTSEQVIWVGGFLPPSTTYTHSGLSTAISVGGLNLSRTYASEGQLLSTTDANGSVTKFWHDGAGNPVQIKDAAGNITSTDYNNLG